LVDQRPTYGYRRITALLNRARALQGAPPVCGLSSATIFINPTPDAATALAKIDR
jgi:hypothetical protein